MVTKSAFYHLLPTLPGISMTHRTEHPECSIVSVGDGAFINLMCTTDWSPVVARLCRGIKSTISRVQCVDSKYKQMENSIKFKTQGKGTIPHFRDVISAFELTHQRNFPSHLRISLGRNGRNPWERSWKLTTEIVHH